MPDCDDVSYEKRNVQQFVFWQRPVSPYSVQLAVKCFRPLVHHCSPVDVNTRCLGDSVEMIRPRGEQ